MVASALVAFVLGPVAGFLFAAVLGSLSGFVIASWYAGRGGELDARARRAWKRMRAIVHAPFAPAPRPRLAR
jgi:hypothetical protein